MGPSRKSVINANTHATSAKIAETLSPLAMKNANGSTRRRRTDVSALAIAAYSGPSTPHERRHIRPSIHRVGVGHQFARADEHATWLIEPAHAGEAVR